MSKARMIKARRVARLCYIQCDGDYDSTCAMIKAKKKEIVGNPLIAIFVIAGILQACFWAIKVWNELNLKSPPWRPVAGEGFKLAVGEQYEMSHLELAIMLEEMRACNEL